MKKFSILSLAMMGMAIGPAVAPVAAATSGFDFTQCTVGSNYFGVSQTESGSCGVNGYSNTTNQFKVTLGSGLSVTATAYTTGTGAGDSSAVGTTLLGGTNAIVGQYSGNGLGTCSIGDSGFSTTNSLAGCNSPAHQVDDSVSYEFVLFTFSSAVNVNDIVLANYGGNGTLSQNLAAMGFTYWVNPSSEATIIAGGTTVLCGTGGANACQTADGNGAGIGSADGSWFSGFGSNGQGTLTGVTQLLVGAATTETNDFFKIQGLQTSANSQTATPEPATFGMVGLALLGVGLYNRKRKSGSQD